MDPMSATVRAIFYTIAFICFAVAAIAEGRTVRVNLVATGLAFFVFVAMWDSWALA